jgi:hypothetical protein
MSTQIAWRSDLPLRNAGSAWGKCHDGPSSPFARALRSLWPGHLGGCSACLRASRSSIRSASADNSAASAIAST